MTSAPPNDPARATKGASGGTSGKPPTYTQFRMLATAASIGLAVVIAIFLGLGLGLLLDNYLGTKPLLTIVGLILGVAAGFRNLWIMASRIEKGQEKTPPLWKSSLKPNTDAADDDEPDLDEEDWPWSNENHLTEAKNQAINDSPQTSENNLADIFTQADQDELATLKKLMKDAPEDDFEGILKEARLLNPTKDKGPKDDQ